MSLKITVIGGGNGGHAASADLTLRGYDVCMVEDEKFVHKMQKVLDTKTIQLKGACGTGTAHIHNVTTDLKEGVTGADLIVLAVPAFAHTYYAKKLADVVTNGQIVLVVPGTFGSLIFYNEFKKQGIEDVIVAETHTLPYATRLTGDGEVLIMSRFDPLKIGVMPSYKTQEVIDRIDGVFPGLEPVESVIACGLSSLNPIIHVPGCILNAGRIEVAKGDFFFYTEGFSSCVARACVAIDQERMSILKAFGYSYDMAAHGIGGSFVSDNLEEVIAKDPNFAKIKGPADFTNRYYVEDIPFGIASWAKLAHAYNISVPILDSLVTMGSLILEEDCWNKGYTLKDYGIDSMDLKTLKQYVIYG